MYIKLGIKNQLWDRLSFEATFFISRADSFQAKHSWTSWNHANDDLKKLLCIISQHLE